MNKKILKVGTGFGQVEPVKKGKKKESDKAASDADSLYKMVPSPGSGDWVVSSGQS
jgi:hypothetical protein